MAMGMNENERQITSNCKTGTLLFVADFVTGRSEVLDFACELAERQNSDLQLLHVIDPEHTHSSPDAQMEDQFSLDMLAQRARALKRSAVRRAAEVNASVVVLPLNGSAADRLQKKLVRRLRGKCECPVLAVPRDIFLDADANSHSIRRLFSLVQQVCQGDRRSMRTLERASDKIQSQAPLMIMPKSAYFLRR
jgi:hypothetical protein